jgi:hypothetical protein
VLCRDARGRAAAAPRAPGASGGAAMVAGARAPAISDPARDRSINPARAAAPPLLV